MRNYWTGEFLTGLPDEAIEVLCRFHLSKPSPLSEIFLLPGGGALRTGAGRDDGGRRARVRRSTSTSSRSGRTRATTTANIAWTRALSTAIRPFTTGRVYVNFIGDEGQDRVVASFGAETYARLQELKARYDPENLFRTSQNIKPEPRHRRERPLV